MPRATLVSTFVPLCGETQPESAESSNIRGYVRRNATRKRPSSSNIRGLVRRNAASEKESYEVQARQRRAYSPSAATSSEWLPSSAIRPSITTAMRSAS